MNPIDTLYFNLGRLEGIASCLPQEQFEVGRKLDKIAADIKKFIDEYMTQPAAPKQEISPNIKVPPKQDQGQITPPPISKDPLPPTPLAKKSNIDPLAAEMRAVGYRPDPTIRR